jgi:hypothetical protein
VLALQCQLRFFLVFVGPQAEIVAEPRVLGFLLPSHKR